MKKLFTILLSLLYMFNSSVGQALPLPWFRSWEIGTEQEDAQINAGRFFDALNIGDLDAARGFFSQRAIIEDADFDADFEQLCQIFSRNIISWSCSGGISVGGRNSHGIHSTSTEMPIKVYTKNGIYHLYLEQFHLNEIDSSNVGFYALTIMDHASYVFAGLPDEHGITSSPFRKGNGKYGIIFLSMEDYQ